MSKHTTRKANNTRTLVSQPNSESTSIGSEIASATILFIPDFARITGSPLRGLLLSYLVMACESVSAPYCGLEDEQIVSRLGCSLGQFKAARTRLMETGVIRFWVDDSRAQYSVDKTLVERKIERLNSTPDALR